MKKFVRVFMVLALAIALVPQNAAHAATAYSGRIAYTTSANDIKAIRPVVGSLGTQTIITGNTHYNPSYSPDGTKIAYLLGTAPTILYIADADGSNAREITPGGFYNDVSWAPDGKSLLATITGYNGNNNFNIFKLDLDGAVITQLTNFAYYTYGPKYSPDGSKIIYHAKNNNDIMMMNADGTGTTNLTGGTAGAVTVNKPMFSPDGTKIIYSKIVSGNEVLGMMNADGSGKVTIPTAGNLAASAVYSPDGTRIAYVTGTALHAINTDGSNDITYTNDATGGLSWQPRTLGPTAASSTLNVSLSNGKAIIDVAANFTDPYGEGVNKGSLSITANPSYGKTSVDTTNGIVTYTPNATAATDNWLDQIAAVFVPPVSAAAASDSFTYRICSNANAALCSTGTVNVNLLGAPNTGGGVPPSPVTTVVAYGLLSFGLAGVITGFRKLAKKQ